ncbi:hypothetical protein AB0F92_26825 [Kitasatospora aureofaciens]|uniref:Uncharacterized protein n=1 Tax=Kitasatospora aureofaciens TaxID=1894 RepID=A0A1E7N928_KITAU|nr:hypothetical protein [Kitasatospora aureofaciens]ARF81567.1 hypothetical protein B6264_24035 [Kitasatospora aureofaciens]OEV37168.1 hypothetical protein HS99_0004955 [Kitasatospora aureofaciens]UKZ03241.1 hypothetical protein BOQ63_003805 [Streptomyces viridifaciens]
MRAVKPTFLVAVAHARAVARRDSASSEVLGRRPGDPALDDGGLTEVRRVLVATGARAAVQARIERLSERSLEHLERVRPHARGAERPAALPRVAAGLARGPFRGEEGGA